MVTEKDLEAARTTVTFTRKTLDRLVKHIIKKYGRLGKFQSLTIEEAVIEFLDKHETEGG